MPRLVRVASVDEIPTGRGKTIEVDGRMLAVFNAGAGRYHAASPFLKSPGGFGSELMNDDAAAIKLELKLEPVDVELWSAEIDENRLEGADDNTMYSGRATVSFTPKTRASVDTLVVHTQCLARRANGSCVSTNFGDTF